MVSNGKVTPSTTTSTKPLPPLSNVSPPAEQTIDRNALQPPRVPDAAVAFFVNDRETERIYASAWAMAYKKMGALAEGEKVVWQQMRCLPNAAPKGYWWRAVVVTTKRLIVIEGNNAEFCACRQCGLWGLGDKIHKLCGVEILLNVSTEHYRWTEVVAVKANTVSGPGRFPGLKFVPKCGDCRADYKSCCLDILNCWIACCPCCFKYREKLPSCLKFCPILVETAEITVALNSEGFSYNPFYSVFAPFGGGIFKSYTTQELTMGHEEAVEFLNIVTKYMPKKES